MIPRRGAAIGAALAALSLAGCEREQRITSERPLPRAGAPAVVRTSDLVAGELKMPPGVHSPYAGNPNAIAEGKRLYQWMNCAGCHGLNGGGGIGPPFADSDWIYGSRPVNVYQSIVQGRPAGMPAFDRLSDDVVWKLVAYVRTLDPALDATGEAEALMETAQPKENTAEEGDG
jgi:cytochrome c oxidase cbb3-type subunit III